MQAVPTPSQILYTVNNFYYTVEKIFPLGGPHSTVASYFGVMGISSQPLKKKSVGKKKERASLRKALSIFTI
jgi:hypothetical protein